MGRLQNSKGTDVRHDRADSCGNRQAIPILMIPKDDDGSKVMRAQVMMIQVVRRRKSFQTGDRKLPKRTSEESVMDSFDNDLVQEK